MNDPETLTAILAREGDDALVVVDGDLRIREASAEAASLAARADGPLWYRGLAQEDETAFAPQLEQILSKLEARAIVIGHTIASGGRIASRFGGKLFQIDTGMLTSYYPEGRASALEIQDGRFTAIYMDRRDVLLEPKQ